MRTHVISNNLTAMYGAANNNKYCKVMSNNLDYQIKNIESINKKDSILKPNQSELKAILRAKYPQSKFGTLYIENAPRKDGKFYVHYDSKGICCPFNEFCEQFFIDSELITMSEHDGSPIEKVAGINVPKKDRKAKQISSIVYAEKGTSFYDECLLQLVIKCSVPVETLEKLGVKPIYSYYDFAGNQQGNTIYWGGYGKNQYSVPTITAQSLDLGVKYINGKSKLWVHTVHNYLMGHENYFTHESFLSEKTRAVCLLEGETDTIAFNGYMLPFDIVGVTVGGVGGWVNATEQLNYIRKLAPNATIISLFDNDTAGMETALKMLEKHNIKPVFWKDFLGDVKDKFDVCDAFQLENGKEATLNKIESLLPMTIKVNNFIGEKFNKVVDYIANCRKMLIHANTGTGKTYFVGQMANEITFGKLGIKRIIYVVPRRMLSKDIDKDMRKRGISAMIVKRKHTESDVMDCSVLICTVDALPRLDSLIDSSLMVLDEPQKHESDMGFRSSPRNILSRLNQAVKVIAITATPNLDLYEVLGFSYLRVNAERRTKHVKTTFLAFDKMTYVAAILGQIQQIKGRVVVLLQDKSDLYEIERALPNRKSIVINADTVDDVMTKDLSEYDLFLCTSVVDAGVNFHFHIDTFIAPFGTRVCDLAQLVGRDRTDLERNLIVLQKKAEKEPEKMGQSNFLKAAQGAEKVCNTFNAVQDDIPYEKYDRKPMESVYTYYNDNMYCVDYLKLANNCYVHPLTFDEMFERLRGFDNAFQSFEVKTALENAELTQIAKSEAKVTRKEREAAKVEVLEQISTDIETFAQVIANTTKSEKLKEQIETVFKLSPEAKITIANEECQTSLVMSIGEKLVTQYVDIVPFHMPKSTAFLGLTELQKTRFKAVLMTQTQLKDTKSGKEHVLRREKVKELKKVLAGLRERHVNDLKQFVKVVEKHGIYGDEIDRVVTHLDAKLLRIYELYDYDEIRDEATDNLIGLKLKKAWTLDAIKAIYDGGGIFWDNKGELEDIAEYRKDQKQTAKDEKIALKNSEKLEKLKEKAALEDAKAVQKIKAKAAKSS